MNDIPRQALCEIIAQYGPSLSDDPRRTEALLRDFCGAYKREIFCLVSALREQVASDLLASRDGVPHQVLLARLTRRLQDNLALAEDAARWAVESWALALGVIERPLPSPPPRVEGEGPFPASPRQRGRREGASVRVAVSTPPQWGRPPEPVSDYAPTDERLVRVLEGHTSWVHSVAFHPHGHLLASGSKDGTVRLWDVSAVLDTSAVGSQEARWPLRSTSSVHCVAFSPDGRLLAWGSGDGTVELRDAARSRKLHRLKGHVGEVNSVAFSPDGCTLAADSGNDVVLWDVTSGREVRQLKGHKHVVQSVAFSPDGRFLASVSEDKTVRLWSVASGRAVQVRRLEGHTEAVWSVAFSPDGRALASGSYDKTVQLWDVASGRKLRLLEGHPGGVNSVAFSPDGHILAAASWDTVVLWDVSAVLRPEGDEGLNAGVASCRKVRQLEGHTLMVQSVAFSPDGRLLASGSWDGTVRLWIVKRNSL